MSKVVSANVKREKPVFDPSQGYKWEPDDVFEITGIQLASFFHTLSKEINDIGGAPISMKVEAYNNILEVLKRGVEQGVIVSAPHEPQPVVSEAEVIDLFNQK